MRPGELPLLALTQPVPARKMGFPSATDGRHEESSRRKFGAGQMCIAFGSFRFDNYATSALLSLRDQDEEPAELWSWDSGKGGLFVTFRRLFQPDAESPLTLSLTNGSRDPARVEGRVFVRCGD